MDEVPKEGRKIVRMVQRIRLKRFPRLRLSPQGVSGVYQG